MGLTVKINGIDAAINAVGSLKAETEKIIQAEMNGFALETANDAREFAPADEGNLRTSIFHEYGKLKATVFARTNYAAYLEFGTRKFAAAYVNSLPADWKSYAAQFRGSGGGNGDYFEIIRKWVKRKGIDDAAAYAIALSILRNGIKAQPFLYPAFQKNLVKLESKLKELEK